MNNLTDYIRDFYSPHLTFNSLVEMVEHELKNLQNMLVEETIHAPTELAVSAVPEIPISEIAWGRLRTGEGKTVDTAQRVQLDNFLKNIGGNDLKEKIESINEFYNMSEDTAASLIGESSAGTVARTLAYLTFFKTLTTIITNFNAASAGFSFEAFLGVLLGGTQVPTNSNTIADLRAQDGTLISLKLYREESTKVDGSYTDLINDIVSDGYMQYVVVMKNLEEAEKGNPLTLGGSLNFYRFNLTLGNVMTIFSQTKKASNIQLPISFLQDSESDFTADLPAATDISPEELESQFVEKVRAMWPDMADQIVDHVDWAKREELYVGNQVPGRDGFRKGKGKYKVVGAPIFNVLQPLVYDENTNQGGVITPEQQEEIAARLMAFNHEIVSWRAGLNVKRDEAIGKFKWASIEDSRDFYNQLDPDGQRRALRVSRGYLYNNQFHMSRGQVKNIEEIAGDHQGLFPPGQSGSYIGTIQVGTQAIINAIQQAQGLINDSIFDIFNNLKVLTTNIQAYFAEGLEDDQKAVTAEKAANTIEGKTQEVRTQ